MSNLSDLLNPATADEQPNSGRRESIPPLHIPDNPHASSQYLEEQARYSGGGSNTHEAAHALASLSSTASTPQQSWQTWQQRQSGSPQMQHGYQGPDGRRMSSYGEGTNSAGLPRAEDLVRKSSTGSQHHETRSPENMLRKMSSPTLHQYHMSSRSPEQIRRSSVIENPDPNFKLPPLQHNISPQISHPQPTSSQPTDHQHVLHAKSEDHTNQDAHPKLSEFAQSASADSHDHPARQDPQLTSQTEPSSTQMESSISQATVGLHSSSVEKKSPISERRASATPIKSEVASSVRDSIPAFVPVAQVKRESIMASTPLRESSVPVPSTEETTPAEPRGLKRPAPKTKKGVAKKGPTVKKQKTGPTTVSKSKSKPKPTTKKPASSTGTPLASSPAPQSARAASSADRSSQSPGVNEFSDGDEEEVGSQGPDDEEYCICRKGDNGTFMIGCDGKCDDWFHGKCVGILEKDKHLIDRYICPNCTDAGVGVTTWKRMCRRAGCRMPARLAKKDEEPSKYCSEECGITFFRDMMGRTRGASDASSVGRKASRKSNAATEPTPDEDLGPRGGAISKAELKSMLNSVSTIDAFKRLGEGVLSPPATPSPKDTKSEPATFLDDAETKRIAEINATKDELRTRHALLKDQAKFVTMLRHNSARIAEAKGIKPKDICGYDDRVRMDEAVFAEWRDSEEGKTALKSGNLPVDTKAEDEDGDTNMDAGGRKGSVAQEVCLRKRCQKHLDWSKLALETNRSEMSENSERMRGLERDERDIKERAGLRARQVKAGDVGGTVEVHGVDMPVLSSQDEKKGLGIEGDIVAGQVSETTAGAAEAVAPTTEAPAAEAMDTPA
ncbi:hypothetical protein C1H76_9091 [Elsinoe australis]|uniref:PHD-type domain-containing protein n=1 Tax=Elsinoe australis TaxID=40998 RepID=A0A4U7AQJ3_9PEZI|nr:hypothetical protein C1H76_9091 [Elsinoe australis]